MVSAGFEPTILGAHGVGMIALQFTSAQQIAVVRDTAALYCATCLLNAKTVKDKAVLVLNHAT
jgi:hypothetical protein